MNFRRNFGFSAKCTALASAAAALASCEDTGSLEHRSMRPIPAETLALMEQVGTNKDAPTLIRSFKKEAELEIWKMGAEGRYVHLKTYPMCRWSGQLGPKVREGDRQAPEGFYSIGPAQMNPNSSYYLSFNVGYPNAYDRAWGHGGGSIMVHGACSSAGCFSMTDKQIAEIYAIARSSFDGGQRAVQMQSFPFRMTAENLAKHRLDPNIGFWKQLKEGSDHFEVAGREPSVAVCGKRYVFDAVAANGQSFDPEAPCPALKQNDEIKALVTEKQARDDAEVAELVAAGAPAVRTVYQDGGQHPDFWARAADVSRPEALTAAPVEIALVDKSAKNAAKPAARSPVIAVAAARTAAQTKAVVGFPTAPSGGATTADPAAEPSPAAFASEATGSVGGWLGLRKGTPAPQPAAGVPPSEQRTTRETDAPSPSRRPADGGKKPQASLEQAPKNQPAKASALSSAATDSAPRAGAAPETPAQH